MVQHMFEAEDGKTQPLTVTQLGMSSPNSTHCRTRLLPTIAFISAGWHGHAAAVHARRHDGAGRRVLRPRTSARRWLLSPRHRAARPVRCDARPPVPPPHPVAPEPPSSSTAPDDGAIETFATGAGDEAGETHREHPPQTVVAGAPPPGGAFYLGAAVALAAAAAALPAVLAAAAAATTSGGGHQQLPPDAFASHRVMLGAVGAFALAHSGLASLRPAAAAVIGERLYRVAFALVSVPSAVLTVAYFVAHRYDGLQLWRLQGVPGVHEACFALTFLSFLLLYPATFNLLEVAAVQRPGFRIYEAGVMRITRHPQLWGQVLWCVAHCAWIGTSLSVVASLALVAHHCFAVWNGDRRLRDRYGAEWDAYASRTSVLPFRAVLDGRQTICWREFGLKAYAGVTVFILAAYAAHPAMQRAAASLHL